MDAVEFNNSGILNGIINNGKSIGIQQHGVYLIQYTVVIEENQIHSSFELRSGDAALPGSQLNLLGLQGEVASGHVITEMPAGAEIQLVTSTGTDIQSASMTILRLKD